jgi:hypothetical protein
VARSLGARLVRQTSGRVKAGGLNPRTGDASDHVASSVGESDSEFRDALPTCETEMITTPTVFVLGAGASLPYGYPTAIKLRDEIVEGSVKKDLAVLEFAGHEIQEFAIALQKSRLPSVDAFLEHRDEFFRIGKAAIAVMLVKREDDGFLRRSDRGDDWYEYLWRQIMEGVHDVEDFKKNNISIVTFNYDRSFERYFSEALLHTFDLDGPAAAILFRTTVKVVHVHGHLGHLPHFSHDGHGERAYGRNEPGDIEGAVTTITIVRTKAVPGKEFKQAGVLVSRAKRVCFLGFGYHRQNVERLLLNGLRLSKGKEVWCGSAYGMTVPEKEKVSSILRGGYRIGSFTFGGPEQDSLTFIREVAHLFD